MTDSEDDLDENFMMSKSSKALLGRRQRFHSVNTDTEPITKRRLSYSKEMEDLFIATFPLDTDITRLKLELMVERGIIMDESVEYVEHIFKKNKVPTKRSL